MNYIALFAGIISSISFTGASSFQSSTLTDICAILQCRISTDPFGGTNVQYLPTAERFSQDQYAQLIEQLNALDKASLVVDIPVARFGEVYENFLQLYNREHDGTQRELKLHHAAENSGFINFVAWTAAGHSKVPSYMTSTRGATAFIVQRDSPDDDDISVLLVEEYGKWKGVSGSVDLGELPLEAAVREALEEVGIVIDSRFSEPNLVGAKSFMRKNNVAGEHFFYTFETKQRVVGKVMDGEVTALKWFKLKEILSIEPDSNGDRSAPSSDGGKPLKFDPFVLKMLLVAQQNKGISVDKASRTINYMIPAIE